MAIDDERVDGSVSRAAENAMLRFSSRWMMVLGIPALFATLAWGGRELVTATNANTLATARLEEKLVGMQASITYSVGLLNSRFDAQDRRGDANDRRNDAQDTKIDSLQQRVWQIPSGGKVVP